MAEWPSIQGHSGDFVAIAVVVVVVVVVVIRESMSVNATNISAPTSSEK